VVDACVCAVTPSTTHDVHHMHVSYRFPITYRSTQPAINHEQTDYIYSMSAHAPPPRVGCCGKLWCVTGKERERGVVVLRTPPRDKQERLLTETNRRVGLRTEVWSHASTVHDSFGATSVSALV
jgi:hypothetical protein